MPALIKYTRGKHRGKYVKETPGRPFWDDVGRAEATVYRDRAEAHKRIMELCAKAGDELYLVPVDFSFPTQ